MKKVLLLSLIAVSVALLAAAMSGCGSNGTPGVLAPPTVTPTPTPTPTPPTTTTPTMVSLRADGPTNTTATPMTRQQRREARRAAKIAHATRQHQGAITVDSGSVNIYVWPAGLDSAGFWGWGSERKITDSSAAYTSAHLSLNKSSMVFSAIVNGYDQIFTGTVPAEGQPMAEPTQLTLDPEHHWVPHISPDGSKVVFTKFDLNSNGDVVCVMENALGAIENCLDFSASTPVLKGANTWHASWTPDGKIVFEAWGGLFNSDEIFMVNADGSGLIQITHNAGSKNYDECPSVSNDGNWMMVDTWNNSTGHYEIWLYNLSLKLRIENLYGVVDAWDPLYTEYTQVWVSVSGLATERHEQLYYMSNTSPMSHSPAPLTKGIYANYFESSPRQ